jgi:hypothetical protein
MEYRIVFGVIVAGKTENSIPVLICREERLIAAHRDYVSFNEQ